MYDWEENYPPPKVSSLVREKSDHKPLLLDTTGIQRFDPIFRFESSWFLREGLGKTAYDTWNDPSITGSNIEKTQKI